MMFMAVYTPILTSFKPLSIAPMIDWSDRHYRYFMRRMTQRTVLYTEMITTGALIFGDTKRFLDYHPEENPLVLQLGGSDPKALAQCAGLAQEYGYVEVNLNVGCPSDRVQAGKFGACLMAEPELVAACVQAMKEACDLPVTVKTRLGVDELDSYEFLTQFIQTVSEAGCHEFIMHARKAWLKGLSPKENREIPPLCYDRVYQLKKDFPALTIIINGGITDFETAKDQLKYVDGVMIGRAAYNEPYLFSVADQTFFGVDKKTLTRAEVAEAMFPYIDDQLSQGVRLHSIIRHMLNLFNGKPGARYWRQTLSKASTMPASEGFSAMKNMLKELSDL